MWRDISAATTNQHYIYLLGWWLTDNFPIQEGNTTTINRLFSAASRRNVQMRAMLWQQWRSKNRAEVDRINALPNGAAIRDNLTLNYGSHHQKVLVVNGSDGLIAFCGGIDINPDRLYEKGNRYNRNGDTKGAPLHDVHYRIRGPAAEELLYVFVQRWQDHEDHVALDRRKGTLRGRPNPNANPIPGASKWVQIGRTYGNGAKRAGIRGNRLLQTFGYSFAPKGEQTAGRMIVRGILQAEQFIYVEDQYFVDTTPNLAGLDVRAALIFALKKPTFQHLTVLIPHPAITTMPQGNLRKRDLINALRGVPGVNPAKVRVFNLVPQGNPYTYIHSKTWIFDDQYAIVGSANCCRRSFTHHSEVVAGVCDQGDGRSLWFPHILRMRLWAEHLNVSANVVKDPIASAGLWNNPPAGAHIGPYDTDSLATNWPLENGRKFHFVATARSTSRVGMPSRSKMIASSFIGFPELYELQQLRRRAKTNALRCQGHREGRDISKRTGHLCSIFESRAGIPA
jgi:phosphatidylserine/phosphatidylglycerophosphate/cardiolipin synthase-like enzyme